MTAPQEVRDAGLVYSSDRSPGIERIQAGNKFRYRKDDSFVRDESVIARINALVIPPAWTSVWICANPKGHLQATGRDARGRKQFRYHAEFRAGRDRTKYERLLAFGMKLPDLKRRLRKDLKLPGYPREKVLATVVSLLKETLIRVGNAEYARTNKSFGLTTLRNKHVKVKGATIRFEFAGKSGVRHAIDFNDRRLARIVKGCQELPGQDLFSYEADDGQIKHITSSDVNTYLREATGEEFSAKDLRTWAGTTIALATLSELPPCSRVGETKKCINDALETVAKRLGNTKAVCKSSYVHPAILEAFENGALIKEKQTAARAAKGLSLDEVRLMKFLRNLRGSSRPSPKRSSV